MDLLPYLTARPLIVALAIIGAVAVSAGSLLGQRGAVSTSFARILVRGGYAISLASVGLFIVAGFSR